MEVEKKLAVEHDNKVEDDNKKLGRTVKIFSYMIVVLVAVLMMNELIIG